MENLDRLARSHDLINKKLLVLDQLVADDRCRRNHTFSIYIVYKSEVIIAVFVKKARNVLNVNNTYTPRNCQKYG